MIKKLPFVLLLIIVGLTPLWGMRSIVKRAQVSYPEVARRMHVTGAVRIEVTISPDGKVTNATLVSGNPMLRDAALNAAREYVFQKSDEQSTEVLTINFSMN